MLGEHLNKKCQRFVPDQIAKAQDEDCDACKLYHARQIGFEFLYQHGKHWRDR